MSDLFFKTVYAFLSAHTTAKLFVRTKLTFACMENWKSFVFSNLVF